MCNSSDNKYHCTNAKKQTNETFLFCANTLHTNRRFDCEILYLKKKRKQTAAMDKQTLNGKSFKMNALSSVAVGFYTLSYAVAVALNLFLFLVKLYWLTRFSNQFYCKIDGWNRIQFPTIDTICANRLVALGRIHFKKNFLRSGKETSRCKWLYCKNSFEKRIGSSLGRDRWVIKRVKYASTAPLSINWSPKLIHMIESTNLHCISWKIFVKQCFDGILLKWTHAMLFWSKCANIFTK